MAMLRTTVCLVLPLLLYINGQHSHKVYIIIMTKVLSLHSHEVVIGMAKNAARISILIGPLINYFLIWSAVMVSASNFILKRLILFQLNWKIGSQKLGLLTQVTFQNGTKMRYLAPSSSLFYMETFFISSFFVKKYVFRIFSVDPELELNRRFI